MKPCIVMRSYNDIETIPETLESLHRQRAAFKLFVFDNASTDGTREEVERYTSNIINVPEGAYVPGRVLNRAMEMTTGPIVVFLNSDCTPVDESWLEALLAGFEDEKTAAVFGRQIPRLDCYPLYARDITETYGDGYRQRFFRHIFSMASSAVRRSVWEQTPFSEQLQYSEDIDWTWRVKGRGYRIRYVPDSMVFHSHNYTTGAFYKRHYGEGKAEAKFFEWSFWQRSLLRYSLLPYLRQVLSDARYCLAGHSISCVFRSPSLRMAQLIGRRRGFRSGLREKQK